MILIRRLFFILLGVGVAYIAVNALFSLYLMVLYGVGVQGGGLSHNDEKVAGDLLAFAFAAAFARPVALIAICVAEAFKIRAMITYALGGAAAGVIGYLAFIARGHSGQMPFVTMADSRPLILIACVGVVFGSVYWAIAGRNAGAWRERRVAATSDVQ